MYRRYQPPGFPTKTCSQDNQPLRRHVTLRDMVITPDTVPPFTIPRLCALAGPLASAPSSAAALPVRGLRLPGRPCAVNGLQLTDKMHSIFTFDPAMSLLHLAKVTTPYGFVTLADRPRVRRRESLFFDHEVTRTPRRTDSTGQKIL